MLEKTLLLMSKKEIFKYEIIHRLIRKEINGTEAAEKCGLSVRQVKRLKAKVKEFGAQGLIHGNRGKPGNNRVPDEERNKITKIIEDEYSDFEPTHAKEKLEEHHNINRDPKTIRQIMIEQGLWQPKKGKKKKEHRTWRQRKAHVGEMIQFDGSYEYWFENRNEKCCLLLAVDDATGKPLYARFDRDEGVFPVFDFWAKYIEKYGKPMSIYTDRFSTYSMNHKTAKENPDTLTQFQRAMRELHIDPILARSPEAKGRVEKIFGTLQKRLIKEMRLKGISTREEGNKFLQEEFLEWYGNKYSVAPRGKANFHQKLNKVEKKNLSAILARQELRVVQNDFTVTLGKQWFQLEKKQPALIQKRDKVVVEIRTDKSIHIRLKNKYLNSYPIEKYQRVKNKKLIPWVIPANSPVKSTYLK